MRSTPSLRCRLRRHPIPMVSRFGHCLVLTYAFPADILRRLLPPGLTLDSYGDLGLVAVAAVQARRMRPAGIPAALGRDHLLVGYRVFVRHRTGEGRLLRGLHILRSDTDRRSMAVGGNLLTHYRYHLSRASMHAGGDRLEVQVESAGALADLHVVADLETEPAALPAGSPFAGTGHERRFAGPLPFTFDHEPETDSIVIIRGVRGAWRPRQVAVDVRSVTFLRSPIFGGSEPILASAFHVADVDYRWERGIRSPLGERKAAA